MSRGRPIGVLAGLIVWVAWVAIAHGEDLPRYGPDGASVRGVRVPYPATAYWDSQLAPEVELLWPREEIAVAYQAAARKHRMMAYTLRPADLVALAARCPQADRAERLACLDAPPVAAEVDQRLRRVTLDRALEQMDVDLPGRLTADELAAALAACMPAIDAYLACGAAEGHDVSACTPPRSAIAPCLTRDDAVVERYLDVVADKKAAFGAARAGAFLALLARLPLATVAEVAAACPQRDADELRGCLEQDPRTGLLVFALVAIVESDVGGIPAASGVDVAAFRRRMIGYGLSVNSLRAITGACYQAHPERFRLADPSWPREGLPTLYACIERDAQTDALANPAYIDPDRMRTWLAEARGKVVAALHDAELAHQHAASRRLLVAFGLLAALGLVGVVALPWVWRTAATSAASARDRLAAGVALALTLLVLGGAMLAMRELQGRLAASSTSPRGRIADATFTVLERPAFVARFSDASRQRIDLIKRPLREIVRADRAEVGRRYTSFTLRLAVHWAGLLDEPELHRHHGNAEPAAATRHGATMRSTFGLYRVVDSLMGLAPFLLALASALVYLAPLGGMLRELASGGTGTTARARRLLGAELRVVGLFLAAVLVLLPVGGWVLAGTVEALIELVLTYSLVALAYVGQGGASSAALALSLGSAILLLGLCVALVLATITLYLGALRKVLHDILHLGRPAGAHRRFWRWGTAAAAGLLAFPLAFAQAVAALARGPLAPDSVAPGAIELLLVPVAALALWPALLWAARGGRALRFLQRGPLRGSR